MKGSHLAAFGVSVLAVVAGLYAYSLIGSALAKKAA
jgi:hypothetical protein